MLSPSIFLKALKVSIKKHADTDFHFTSLGLHSDLGHGLVTPNSLYMGQNKIKLFWEGGSSNPEMIYLSMSVCCLLH